MTEKKKHDDEEGQEVAPEPAKTKSDAGGMANAGAAPPGTKQPTKEPGKPHGGESAMDAVKERQKTHPEPPMERKSGDKPT